MRNEDVVKAFYERKCAKTKNLESTGDRLISFNTTIAERTTVLNELKIIKNITRYSVTTSKHQHYVNKFDYIADKVPTNTANLIKYI